jgi:protein translocase SecG subunit
MTPVTTMAHILQIIQIVSSLLLVVLVLIQKASPDIGATLGGDGSSFLQTRRGAERFLFILTIVVAFIFAAASLTAVVVQ